MSQTRQLAAIMFTDISGFTSLMGDDEQKAYAILQKTGLCKNQSLSNLTGPGSRSWGRRSGKFSHRI
ncbi:MAG: hypothetical protein IPN56_09195 [Chitinophagaceae bacterium]|nr:hypothetical protein [Chitinophagaceae bacterium]